MVVARIYQEVSLYLQTRYGATSSWGSWKAIHTAGSNLTAGTISSGAINTTSHITIGTISTTNTGSLFLAGSTANKKAELKCTNGNLHIDPDTANGLYLNYYKGTGGIFFGNGASSYRALMNTSGHLNLASTGASPTGYALAIGTVGVIDTSRNLTNIGTISSGAITASGTSQFTSMYVDDQIISTGDTNTYLQFHSADQFRVVTGGVERLEVNGNGIGVVGDIKIGTTTVIDASRNLTNIGTISSGAITSSGTSNFERFRLTDSSKMGFGTVKAGASIGHTASVDEGIFWHSTSDYGIYRTAGAWSGNYQQLKLKWNTGIEIDGHGTTYGKSGINFLNGNIKMDGTQILDAARNLSNIGNIAATGQLSLSNYAVGNMQSGALNIGNTSNNYAFSAGTWASDVRAGIMANCSETWEMVVHDSGDSVMSFMKYNGSNAFEMGNNIGWGAAPFTFASSITATGNVTAFSDERLKENIQTLDGKKALQMRGVSFIKDGVEGSGVIAQEIEKIAPELVLTADDEMGTKSVAYGNLVGYLIETVKELKSEIDELKARLDNDSSN